MSRLLFVTGALVLLVTLSLFSDASTSILRGNSWAPPRYACEMYRCFGMSRTQQTNSTFFAASIARISMERTRVLAARKQISRALGYVLFFCLFFSFFLVFSSSSSGPFQANRQFQTPPRTDPDWKPAFQDYNTLVGWTTVKYSSDHRSASVTVNYSCAISRSSNSIRENFFFLFH